MNDESINADEKNQDKDKHSINFAYALLTHCINKVTVNIFVNICSFTHLAAK